MQERTCPICGKTYTEHPALSRTDNVTEICPSCGLREALNAAGMPEEMQAEIIATVEGQEQA